VEQVVQDKTVLDRLPSMLQEMVDLLQVHQYLARLFTMLAVAAVERNLQWVLLGVAVEQRLMILVGLVVAQTAQQPEVLGRLILAVAGVEQAKVRLLAALAAQALSSSK